MRHLSRETYSEAQIISAHLAAIPETNFIHDSLIKQSVILQIYYYYILLVIYNFNPPPLHVISSLLYFFWYTFSLFYFVNILTSYYQHQTMNDNAHYSFVTMVTGWPGFLHRSTFRICCLDTTLPHYQR